MIITSSSNEQIKNIINLKEKPKYRKAQGQFIVEGIKMFLEVPKDKLESVYVSESFYEKNTDLFNAADIRVVADSVFKKISDTVTPQGVLCIVNQKQSRLEDFLAGNGRQRFVILDRLQDPGNLGTIIRTAEGAGVTAIIAGNDTVDRYNPKVIRSTMGSIYRVPYIVADNLIDIIGVLQEHGVITYAAHLHGNEYYDDISYENKAAIMIGNESKGLDDEVADKADKLIKIPMCGKVESLNAAVAAAILMYAMR